MDMQILMYVTTAPIEAPFTCWIFYPALIICTGPQIQSVLAQSPGKSRQTETVLSCLSVLLFSNSSNYPSAEILHFSFVVTLSTSFY